MNRTYIISKTLTNTAKKVFGEELIDYASINLPENMNQHAVEEYVKNNLVDNERKEISFDAEEIKVHFINGNTVQFVSSEWASFRKVN